jgi:lysozyme
MTPDSINELRSQLEVDEDKRYKPYRCSKGALTIGIGHNLDAKPISEAAVQQIFNDDFNDVIHDLNTKLPWWKNLDEVRQQVLANMCFNLGISKLLKFKDTLEHLRTGHFALAADAMVNSLWYKQVGMRSRRLVAMMRTGEQA